MSTRAPGILLGGGLLAVLLLPVLVKDVSTKVKDQSVVLDRVEPEVQAVLVRLEAVREKQQKNLAELNALIAQLHACKQSVLAAAIRLNAGANLPPEEFARRMRELADELVRQSSEEIGVRGR
jgi:hypothetical protein